MTALALHPVADTVPQRPPMRLIDEVVARQTDSLTAALTIRSDDLFFRSGHGMPVHVALEWMAQTCAAFAGCEALDGGGSVRVGLLLGTRDFRATRKWFAEGERLYVRARLEYRDEDFGSFACELAETQEGPAVASAGLNVFHPRDAAAVIARAVIAGQVGPKP